MSSLSGFDDTYVDDTEILRCIAVWLAHSYSDGIRLAGIIYLQQVTQAQMWGRTRKNFVMFEKLCRIESAQNVIIATTKWGNVKLDERERRASQLETFWEDILSAGSQMARFDKSHESAWAMVETIISKKPLDALQIQNEMVNLGKRLPQTEAGNALRTSLKNLVAEHKKTIRELRSEKGHGQQVDDRLKETGSQINLLRGQIQELKIPLMRSLWEKVLSEYMGSWNFTRMKEAAVGTWTKVKGPSGDDPTEPREQIFNRSTSTHITTPLQQA
ncbi:hypothetical protein BJ138DRAFT_1167616 [Hygrophoropsis aurantiaca]|uniref:Uncharacterized protein n=1 Tax=Hygrophoropsis aurantiaca TaxID=72124 RepID=A0ACB7ZRS6_9AGAM|nr:hypothetical protein BJ138DRAFT_1167616 [Hygrophoropsis aurantiaca]